MATPEKAISHTTGGMSTKASGVPNDSEAAGTVIKNIEHLLTMRQREKLRKQ